jgi:hypothetical protein
LISDQARQQHVARRDARAEDRRADECRGDGRARGAKQGAGGDKHKRHPQGALDPDPPGDRRGQQ